MNAQLPPGFVLDEEETTAQQGLPPGFVLDAPVEQTQNDGFTGRAKQSVKRGMLGLQSLGYGAAALGADLVGADDTAESMIEGYQAKEKEASAYASDVPTYKDIRTDGVGNFVTDAGKYAVDAVFENLPMFLPSLATGGVGAAIARRGATELVEQTVKKLEKEGIKRELAEELAARDLGKVVAKRTTIGAAAGAYPSSVAMEGGSIYGDIHDDTGEGHAGLALAGGMVAGALDVIPQVAFLNNALGPVADQVKGALIKRLGVEGAKSWLTESTTEGLQTVVEQVTAMQANPDRAFNVDEVIDATLKGGVAGGVLGVTGEGINAIRNRNIQPTDLMATPSTDAVLKQVRDQQLSDQLDAALAAEAATAAPSQPTMIVTPGGTAYPEDADLDVGTAAAIRENETMPARETQAAVDVGLPLVVSPSGTVATPRQAGVPVNVADEYAELRRQGKTDAEIARMGVLPSLEERTKQPLPRPPEATRGPDGGAGSPPNPPSPPLPGTTITFREFQRRTKIKSLAAARDMLASMAKAGEVTLSKDGGTITLIAPVPPTGNEATAQPDPLPRSAPMPSQPKATAAGTARTPDDGAGVVAPDDLAPDIITALRGRGWSDPEILEYTDTLDAGGSAEGKADATAIRKALGTPDERTVPEARATLEAQQRALVEGRRPVQMFPTGTAPLALPQGMASLETPRGVFHYDPAKIAPERITEASAAGRENEVLGLGTQSKADVAASGKPAVVVVERDPQGREVLSAVSTEDQAEALRQDMSSRAGEGHTVAIENPDQVIGERSAVKAASSGSASNPGGLQSGRNSVLADAKLLGNDADAEAIQVKGFDSLDRQRQGMVLAQMRTALNDHKVLRAIIQAVPVDVVDVLVGRQGAAKDVLHDGSVLTHRLAVSGDVPVGQPVSAFVNAVASSLKSGLAVRDTKEPGLVGTEGLGRSGKAAPALSANLVDLGDGHVQSSVVGQPITVNVTPSEAQKHQGNYKKGHVKWNGLDISVETPKGGTRSGTGPDGTRWSVSMPNAYGYIKRTTAADGEQLDISLGDQPDAPQVYVIDQWDPKTGRFDEHKAHGGFASEDDAVKSYDASFSDGSGPSRRGAVSTMTVENFKDWARHGNTKKALDAKPAHIGPKPPKTVQEWVASDRPLDVKKMAQAIGTNEFDVRADLDALVKSGKLKQRQPGKTVVAVQKKLNDDRTKRADLKARGQKVPPVLDKRIAHNEKVIAKAGNAAPYVRVADRGAMSLVQWIAGYTDPETGARGMRDDGGELAKRDLMNHREAYLPKPFHAGGAAQERVAEAAYDAGYIDKADPDVLLEAIKRDVDGKASGNRVYAEGDRADVADKKAERDAEEGDVREQETRRAVKEAMTANGFVLPDASVDDVVQAVAGGRNVDDALDEAVRALEWETASDVPLEPGDVYDDGRDPFQLEDEADQPGTPRRDDRGARQGEPDDAVGQEAGASADGDELAGQRDDADETQDIAGNVDRPNSPEYEAANAAMTKASEKFRTATDAYNAKLINDDTFLAARREFDAAMKKFDAAFEAERDQKPKAASPASDKVDTVDGKRDQLVLPGAEKSAKQAALGRGDKLKSKKAQQEPGGLFAEPDKQGTLFAEDQANGDPPKAEAEALQKALEGKSLEQVADYMAKNAADPVHRLVAERVLVQMKRLAAAGVKFDFKVAHVGDTVPETLLSARGAAHHKWGTDNNSMTIWINGADVTGKVGMRDVTVVHELVHAVTMSATRLGTTSIDGVQVADGTRLRQMAKDLLKVSNAIVDHFNKRAAAFKRGDTTDFTPFEVDMYQRNNNATRSIDEVLAWTLTDKRMQDYLETIPYESAAAGETGTLWTAFVDAVRKFLGLPFGKQTALAEVLRVADQLLSADIGEMQKGAKGANQSLMVENMGRRERASFEAWFGDSKVVDADGKPLVVYHGTDKNLDHFNAHTFFGDRETAVSYAEDRAGGEDGEGATVYPVYLSIQNPARDKDIFAAAKAIGLDSFFDIENESAFAFVSKNYSDAYKQPEIIAELKRRGFDGAILDDDYSMDNPFSAVRSYTIFEPTQAKSVNNKGTWSPTDPRIMYSAAAKRNKKADSSVLTEAFKRWFSGSKVTTPDGKPKRMFRGDARDLGPKLIKGRSESAAGFYFTDNPAVASGYASGKPWIDETKSDFEHWFTFPDFKRKGDRTAPNLTQLWHHLSPDQRERLKDTLLRAVTTDDGRGADTAYGIELKDTPDGGITSREHWDREVRDARGNWLQAANSIWLQGAVIFNEEENFLKILNLAGIKGVFDDPRDSKPVVTPVYLAIRNPVDVTDMDQAFVDTLRQKIKGARRAGSEYYARDMSPQEWVDMLERDIKAGKAIDQEHHFTAIPDRIVKALQAMGYDGVHDKGSKAGGPAGLIDDGAQRHDVWIAFEPSQVKSTFNRGTWDGSNDRLQFSPAARYTPEFAKAEREVRKGIADIIKTVSGGKAKVEFMGTIIGTGAALKASGAETADTQEVAGSYSPMDRLIRIATQGLVDPLKAGLHEVFHDLQSWGTFTENETRALVSSVDRFKAMSVAEGLNPETMSHRELQAVAFSRYATKKLAGEKMSGLLPGVIRAFDKVIDIIRRIKQLLQGRGWTTPEDVFARALSGEVAAREDVTIDEMVGAEAYSAKDTSAFKRWFGKSKMVDKDGKPKVFYHGTRVNIEAFKSGADSGHVRGEDANGIYFTADAFYAGNYTGGETGNILPVYLKIENPLIIGKQNFWDKVRGRVRVDRQKGDVYDSTGNYISREQMAEYKRQGYDGIVNPAAREVIVFDPNQIKSTMNRGTFDPKDDRIQYSVATLDKKAKPIYEGNHVPDIRSKEAQAVSNRVRAPLPASIPIWQRVRERIDEFRENGMKSVLQGIADSYYAVADLERKANEGKLQDASTSAYKMVHATKNLASVMAVVLKHGAVGLDNGGFVHVNDPRFKGGFQAIFDGLGNHGEIELFKDWLIATRAKRLIGEGRENLMDQKDIDTILAEAAKSDGRMQRFKDANAKWQAFNGVLLDMAVKAGRISREQSNFWQSTGDYVPFYRIMDGEGQRDAGGKGGGIRSGGPLSKRLKGGAQQLGDPIENMVMSMTKIVDSSFKNEALRRVIDLAVDAGVAVKRPGVAVQYTAERVNEMLEENGVNMAALPPADRDKWVKMLASMVEPPGDGVTLWRDGKPERYDILDPFLMRSLTSLSPAQLGGVMKVLRGAKRLLTEGVTMSPAFMAANFIRDSLSTWAVGGQKKYNPLIDAPRGLLKAWKEDPSLIAISAAGGGGQGHYDITPSDVRDQIDKRLRSIDENRVVNTVKKAWELWHRIGRASEQANRIAIYNKVIEAGGTPAEAAYQARDLLDFSMRGDYAAVRFLTEVVPFLNARIQGLYRLYRGAVKGAPDSPEGVQKQFLMVGMLIMGASLALAMANEDDPRYDALQDWEKDTYWNFWIDGEHWRIPKPFEVGAIFATIPERMIRMWSGQDDSKKFVERMVHMVGSTFAVDLRPQLFKPMIESWANKNSFTGNPLVPESMEKLKPEAQYNSNTSETARILGRAVPETINDLTKSGLGFDLKSPLIIDHMIRGYLGELGTYMVSAVDALAGSSTVKPSKRVSDYPVVSRFFRGDDVRTERYVGDFYKMREQTESVVDTVKKYALRGEVDRAKEMLADPENQEKMAMRGAIAQAYKTISGLTDAIRKVHDSKTLTADQKRTQIDKLTAQRNQVAKSVVQRAPAIAALMRAAQGSAAADKKLAPYR